MPAGPVSPGPFGAGVERLLAQRPCSATTSLKSPDASTMLKSRGLHVDMPAPVKSYPLQSLGFLRLFGNVWSGCQDWYGPYPKGIGCGSSMDSDSGDRKVRRGGSWFREVWFFRSAKPATWPIPHQVCRPSASGRSGSFKRDFGNGKR